MKRGFTMVELLVVVGILGILVAILVGALGGSTESARTARCMTNMRNLAMAVQTTAMANGTSTDNCYYPFAGSFTRNDKSYQPGWIGWASKSAGGYCDLYEKDPETRRDVYENGSIWKAMNGNADAYVCPGHKSYANEKSKGNPLWSYAMNAYFGWSGNPSKYGRSYTGFKRADKFLLFAELQYRQENLSGTEADPVLQYQGCAGGGDEAIAFHHKAGKNSVATVCFADGHVEKLVSPKEGDVKELTAWLCRPRDDQGNDFDISFDGTRYKKVQ